MQWINLFLMLSILIVLHELGHYLAARVTGTRVEKFYLFFDFLFPFSTLLPFSLFKKKKGDTEYGIGWFPLGGYVKIAGMVDESMDKEAMKKPPQPWEYRTKNVWQRFLMMFGGIFMNLLVGFLIYSFILCKYGEKYYPPEKLTNGLAFDSVAKSTGLRDGDIILKVDTERVESFDKVPGMIILNNAKTLSIRRNGKDTVINVVEGTISALAKGGKTDFCEPMMPVIVKEVSKGSEAERIKLSVGDQIISADSIPVTSFGGLHNYLDQHKGMKVMIAYTHGTDTMQSAVKVSGDSRIGFIREIDIDKFFPPVIHPYTFLESIPAGFNKAVSTIGKYFSSIKLLFTSKEIKVKDSLGGFGSFAKIMPTTFNLEDFLGTMALISLILAVANFLPIPGLDGGYILFLLYEMVTRRKVSDKFLEYANMFGLVILLALMLFANGLDIWRKFHGQ
jgi:regulator of sigma E protease